MKTQKFRSFRSVIVPVIYGAKKNPALDAARALDAQVTLVGLVPVAAGESLSLGAAAARQMRQQLRSLSDDIRIRARSRVLVSHQIWNDLLTLIHADEPDLLLLDLDEHFEALGISVSDALLRPPCNVALLRGPFPQGPARILIPLRGGPHAELALRMGLSIRDSQITSLHLSPLEEKHARTDAPFRGLQRVLSQLPEVEKHSMVTGQPAQAILEKASGFNLIIMGATAQPLTSPVSLGLVADQVMKNTNLPVLAVKSRRPMPQTVPDETSGAQAISILVDKWFAENTFHADEFSDLKQLMALKEKSGQTISLALPALNEEETVARVIQTIKRSLMDEVPLLDEIVLVDSNSSDRTREIARDLGIPVYIHQEILPDLGPRPGKGEALWKSLLVTRGDIIAWIDTDIVNIHPRFVYGILGPLLLSPRIQFVKGFYRRPLKTGSTLEAGAGGRVTELTARPLLNLFYPELSGVVQPLAGEYASRRSFLEQTPFFSTYGVETGLLIDVFEAHGLAAIAQVDLLERIHHNQSLEALSKMSFVIIQAFLRKLEKRYGQQMVEDVNKSMKLIRHTASGYSLEVAEIIEHERPPMLDVAAYREWLEQISAKILAI
ncbi:MAG: glucosyl-3-phosphoglycerate synthase [Chloroflexi bacterium]|nr:glucosyl-3-phosphoglycerate synthase [Chloroflexota bacterium]